MIKLYLNKRAITYQNSKSKKKKESLIPVLLIFDLDKSFQCWNWCLINIASWLLRKILFVLFLSLFFLLNELVYSVSELYNVKMFGNIYSACNFVISNHIVTSFFFLISYVIILFVYHLITQLDNSFLFHRTQLPYSAHITLLSTSQFIHNFRTIDHLSQKILFLRLKLT